MTAETHNEEFRIHQKRIARINLSEVHTNIYCLVWSLIPIQIITIRKKNKKKTTTTRERRTTSETY